MSHQAVGARPGRRMVSLGKVTVPKPMNLPSQRRENNGFDPNVTIVPKSASGWGDPNAASDMPLQSNGPSAWANGPSSNVPSASGPWATPAAQQLPPPPRNKNPSAKDDFPELAIGKPIDEDAQQAADVEAENPGWDADERNTALPGHLVEQQPQPPLDRDVEVLGYRRGMPQSSADQEESNSAGHHARELSSSQPDRWQPQQGVAQLSEGQNGVGQHHNGLPDRPEQGKPTDRMSSEPLREQPSNQQSQGMPTNASLQVLGPARGVRDNRGSSVQMPLPHHPHLQYQNRLPPREDTGSYSRGPLGPPRERHLFGDRGPIANGHRRTDYGRGQRHVNDDRDWMARPNGILPPRHASRPKGGPGRYRNEDARYLESPRSSASDSTIRTTKATVGTTSYVAASDLGSIVDEDSTPLDRTAPEVPPLAEGERRLSEVSRRSEPQQTQDTAMSTSPQQTTAAGNKQQTHLPQQDVKQPQPQQQQQQQQQPPQPQGVVLQKSGRPRGGERERERRARKAAAAERAAEAVSARDLDKQSAPSRDPAQSALPAQQELPLPPQPTAPAQGSNVAPANRLPGPGSELQPGHNALREVPQQPQHLQQPQQHHQQPLQAQLQQQQPQSTQAALQQSYVQQMAPQVAGKGLPPQLALNVGSVPAVSAPYGSQMAGNAVMPPPQQLQFMQDSTFGLVPSSNGPVMNGPPRPQQQPPRGQHAQGPMPRPQQPHQQQPQLGMQLQRLSVQDPQRHNQGYMFAPGHRPPPPAGFGQVNSASHQYRPQQPRQQQQQQQHHHRHYQAQQQHQQLPTDLVPVPQSQAQSSGPSGPKSQLPDSRQTQQENQDSSVPGVQPQQPPFGQPDASGPQGLQPIPQQADSSRAQSMHERFNGSNTGKSAEMQTQFMHRKAAERAAKLRRNDGIKREGSTGPALGEQTSGGQLKDTDVEPLGPPPGALGLPPNGIGSGIGRGPGRGREARGYDRADRRRGGRGRGREGRGGRGSDPVGGERGSGGVIDDDETKIASQSQGAQDSGPEPVIPQQPPDGSHGGQNRSHRPPRREKGGRGGGGDRSRNQDSDAAPEPGGKHRNRRGGRSSDVRNNDNTAVVDDGTFSTGDDPSASRRPRGGGHSGANPRSVPSTQGGGHSSAGNSAGVTTATGLTAVDAGAAPPAADGGPVAPATATDVPRNERRRGSNHRSSRAGRGKSKARAEGASAVPVVEANTGSNPAATVQPSPAPSAAAPAE